MSSRSGEAFWWSLFSGGGVMAALFIPILAIITGFALPAMGDAASTYGLLKTALASLPAKVVLLGVIALSFFHVAHRIRHTLVELGLRGVAMILAVLCYGGALAGSAVAGMLLFNI